MVFHDMAADAADCLFSIGLRNAYDNIVVITDNAGFPLGAKGSGTQPETYVKFKAI